MVPTLFVAALMPTGLWVAGLRAAPQPPLPPPVQPVTPPSPAWAEAFWAEARPLLEAHPGRVGLHVREPTRGTEVSHNADERMYLASGIKLLVMVELYRQREAGELSFDEEIGYRRKDVRDGAPSMNKHRLGKRLTIAELLTYMIRDSDNAAADLLMERVGAERVGAELRKAGYVDIGPVVPLMDVRRDVFARLDPRAADLDAVEIRDVGWHPGFEPRLDILKKHIKKNGGTWGSFGHEELDVAYRDYYDLGRNHASMRTIADLYDAMLAGRLVSPKADRAMLDRLAQVWTCECRVDGDLPAGVGVAHKTGTQHQRVTDLAIIYLDDDDPLIFTIAVEGDREEAEKQIAALARAATVAALAVHHGERLANN
jgi:beta-lactamase class A